MKRIISAFILLFICIGICIYGTIATQKKTDLLLSLLNEAEYSINIGNLEKALESSGRLKEEWNRAEKFFSSVSETALIDELDLLLAGIEKYILADMVEDAVIVIEECRTGLETILRRQRISIDNIL